MLAPNEAIVSIWRATPAKNAYMDGNGEVDFEEFMLWYRKNSKMALTSSLPHQKDHGERLRLKLCSYSSDPMQSWRNLAVYSLIEFMSENRRIRRVGRPKIIEIEEFTRTRQARERDA